MSSLPCPHCAQPLLRASAEGSKLRARTRIVVLHKAAGEVELNCDCCGGAVIIGHLRELSLRKAVRLVVSIS